MVLIVIGPDKHAACRLSAGGQSGRATSAEKALEKLQLDPQEKPFEERKRSFRFPAVENMGELAVEISGLTHGYNDRLLFKNVDLEIGKGERIAIIGPNGAGKSTLLRLIMGTEAPQEGEVRPRIPLRCRVLTSDLILPCCGLVVMRFRRKSLGVTPGTKGGVQRRLRQPEYAQSCLARCDGLPWGKVALRTCKRV